jgi:DNA-binding CsgD family transcriptional regulator
MSDTLPRDLLLELFRLTSLITYLPIDDSNELEAIRQELENALRSLRRALRLADRRASARHPSLTHVLSEREREIARCLAMGKSYKEVAMEFGLTVASAQSRVRSIYLKLGIHSKGEIKLVLERADDGELPGRPLRG